MTTSNCTHLPADPIAVPATAPAPAPAVSAPALAHGTVSTDRLMPGAPLDGPRRGRRRS